MSITNQMLTKFKQRFDQDVASRTVANAIAKNGVAASSLNNEVLRNHSFKFSISVKEAEITDQKQSGRCWMFASYNVLRLQLMKKLNLSTFEFSEVYLFFMDKMEKANAFLDNMIAHIEEPLDSRLMVSLLDGSVSDGNWWENFDALVTKYGCVPKSVMPETFESSNSRDFVEQIDLRLKRTTMLMRKAHAAGDQNHIQTLKDEALYEVYNICTKALGALPETFDYAYQDKDKKYHRLTNLTPMQFYQEYVGDYFKDKVSLLEDPRGKYPYGKRLEVKFNSFVSGGRAVSSINVPQDEIRKAAIASLQTGEAVWFACDVAKNCDRKLGIMDKNIYTYDQTLTGLGEFSRAERIDLRCTELTHAMTFVGVDLDTDAKPLFWQVENSWGDKVGDKGIFSMHDNWFENENIMIIVDKKFVDQQWLQALEEEPIMLEPWEPYAAMLCGHQRHR